MLAIPFPNTFRQTHSAFFIIGCISTSFSFIRQSKKDSSPERLPRGIRLPGVLVFFNRLWIEDSGRSTGYGYGDCDSHEQQNFDQWQIPWQSNK
jgi:hypothetical protein